MLIGANIIHKKMRNINLFETTYEPTVTMSKLSPIGYHLNDVVEYLFTKYFYFLNETAEQDIYSTIQKNQYNYRPNSKTGLFHNSNVIILQIESLENFVINQKIHDQEITPFLNKLIQKSIYCNNFYEQINNGGSSDADFILNTSLYPPLKSSAFISYSSNYYRSLAWYLNQSGYKTIAVKQDKYFFYNWKNAYSNLHYKKCYDREYFKNAEYVNDNITDSSLFMNFTNILSNTPQPFMSHISTITSHVPYELPQSFKQLELLPEENNSIVGKYFQAINYTDRQIENFFNWLQTQPFYSNTVVILYGDHTSLNRYFSDKKESEPNQFKKYFNDVKKVPLIIFSPKSNPEIISKFCGQIDLMPTILNLLEINVRDDNRRLIFGHDIFDDRYNYVISNNKILGEIPINVEPMKQIRISDLIIKSNYFGKFYNFSKSK